LLIGNLLQSQEVTPSSHHSIMRWLLESAYSKTPKSAIGRFRYRKDNSLFAVTTPAQLRIGG
jgi:hypothetical protein